MGSIWIIKTIYKYIEINPFVYIFALLATITASFSIFIIISFLIIVHELGHFISAKILGVEVEKIIIYPLGGISKFKMSLNISLFKEFIILISGPIFQFIAYFILIFIMPDYYETITLYHYSILVFNLLPIYPFDGGKLINLFFSLKLSFRNSLYLEIFISYITILFLLFINKDNININIVIIIIFLIYKVTSEYKKINLVYNKFLLERYLHKYRFNKSIMIKDVKNFHRNKRHILKKNHNYYLEREILEKFYKKSWHIKKCYAIILLLTVISSYGALAQLGERHVCTVEVSGSIPLCSTIMNLTLRNQRFFCENLFITHITIKY